MASGSNPRIDQWLWSVRVFKTRAAAKKACDAGAVRIDGEIVKPAHRVAVGNTVKARRAGDRIEYRVTKLISKRVSATLAAECFEDFSPPPEPRASPVDKIDPIHLGTREPGAGRPTKRERRQLDRFRGRP